MPAGFAARKAERLARKHIIEEGALTTINGANPTKAVWTEANTARVQLFLRENELTVSAFDVHFPASLLGQVAIDDEVKRLSDGWEGVVRDVVPHPVQESFAAVTVLVLSRTE